MRKLCGRGESLARPQHLWGIRGAAQESPRGERYDAAMLRGFALALIVPALAVLAWLGSARTLPRADFVVACDELRTIDPQRVSWLDEIQLTQCLFEGLTQLDPKTQQPQAAAAGSFTESAGRRHFVFHLRPDLKWSNGAPLLAEHFRYAWLRALDPVNEAQYANLLFVIAGARSYYQSRADHDSANDLPAETVKVAALDDRTLEVDLEQGCPYFLDILALPIFAPLYPPAIERFADASGRIPPAARHLWTRPGNLVCNGLFALESWEFKKGLRLARNPQHREFAEPGVQSIEIMIVGSPNAALVGYQTGRVDLVRTLEPDVARSLRNQQPARADFHLGDRFATYFLRANCRRPPLDKAEFRQALSLAIDREQICENVLGLGETPAYTLVPYRALAHAETPYFPPAGLGAEMSPSERGTAARDLLAKAGINPANVRPIRLACANDPPQQRRINEAIQRMWEQTLGVRVELEVQERKVLSERIRNLDYDLARSDWFGDYLDPGTFLDLFVSNSGQNRTGFEDRNYDSMVQLASAGGNSDTRLAAYARAEQILCADQLPIIPIYYRTGEFLLSPRIDGIYDNVREVLPLYRARLK